MKKILFFMGWLISCSIYSQSELKVFQDWSTTAGTQNFFYKNVTKTDGSGNVYVAGATLNGVGNNDILVAKFNSSGVQQWIRQIDGAAHFQDFATALQLDGSGNVYISGAITNDTVGHFSDLVVVKYNSSGTEQWRATYDYASLYDCGTDISFTSGGNILVAGSSYNGSGNLDFVSILYNSSGVQQWASRYDHSGRNDVPVRIEEDGSDIIVSGAVQTGTSTYSWAVAKYNSSGVFQSVKTGSGGSTGIEEVHAMVTDSTGNIYLAGIVPTMSNGYNYDIIKLDSDLVIQWENTYDGADHLDDIANGIQVNATGDVYVTGSSKSTTGLNDYLTLKYDINGALIWTKIFNDSLNGNDEANAIAMDHSGKIYVTGSALTDSLNNLNYYTIKYDTAGTVEWKIAFDGDKHLNDKATNIAIDTVGNVIVTGLSETAAGVYEYATVRYVEKQIVTPKDFMGEQSQSSFLYYENKGQLLNTGTAAIPRVRYYTNSTYPQYYFMDDTLSMMFQHVDTTASTNDTLQRIDLGFTNHNEHLKIYPLEQQEGYLNYFLPQCPAGGITEIHGNNKLVIPDLYDNIDLVYSSNQNGLKYYFIVKPGGNPDDIKMQYSGINSTSLSGTTLHIEGELDTLSFDRPFTYLLNTSNDTISGSGMYADWHNNTGDNYSFDTHAYDSTKVLIIEADEGNALFASGVTSNQSMEWSTFFGGAGSEVANNVCAKGGNAGNVVTGYTTSNAFLAQSGVVHFAFHNNYDAFVAKFSDIAVNLWIDYIGGNGLDEGQAIALDNAGNSYVVGKSQSADLVQALYSGMNYSTLQGTQDGFYVELNNLGITIIGESYIGGSGDDEARGIAIGNSGGTKEIYIVGRSNNASGFPLQSGGNYNQTSCANYNGFVMKLDAANANQWCTFFGGSGVDYFNDIALRPSNGNPVIVGTTNTSAKAVTSCAVPGTGDNGLPFCDNGGAYYSQNFGGASDNMIVEFDRTNQSLIWSTYFGGTTDESRGYLIGLEYTTPSIAITNSDDVYVAGSASGTYTSFPLLNSLNGGNYNQGWGTGGSGGSSTYIARFDASRNQTWTSFIGGDGGLLTNGICTDGENVYLTGQVNYSTLQSPVDYCTTPAVTEYPLCNESSTNYMETNPTTKRFFINAFDKSDDIIWSTIFGTDLGGMGYGLSAVNNKLYLAGYTNGNNTLWDFNPASTFDYYKTTLSGTAWDATIARFDLSHILIGIEEQKSPNNETLHIYPNPSDGYLFLTLDHELKQEGFITFTDVMGKVLLTRKTGVTEKNFKFDISSFAKGVYFIKLSDSLITKTAKFIKQ